MDEFGLIARYLAPLSGEGAEGLKDDAAMIREGIVTKDLLVAGSHFLPDDPLDLVARKALRANLSDLIAKGARPRGYLLGVVWPREAGEAEWAGFTDGLRADQHAYGISLIGGDTTRHAKKDRPLTISITMIGDAPSRRITRAGARPGELLAVTGTIGDGGLGLAARKEEGPVLTDATRAYFLPEPPLATVDLIARFATASLDVSDGLLGDAGHIAEVSGVRIDITGERVPLSDAGRAAVAAQGGKDALSFLTTAGDDYQTLFTLKAEDEAALMGEAAAAGVQVKVIGEIRQGAPDVTLAWDGAPVDVKAKGWSPFG